MAPLRAANMAPTNADTAAGPGHNTKLNPIVVIINKLLSYQKQKANAPPHTTVKMPVYGLQNVNVYLFHLRNIDRAMKEGRHEDAYDACELMLTYTDLAVELRACLHQVLIASDRDSEYHSAKAEEYRGQLMVMELERQRALVVQFGDANIAQKDVASDDEIAKVTQKEDSGDDYDYNDDDDVENAGGAKKGITGGDRGDEKEKKDSLGVEALKEDTAAPTSTKSASTTQDKKTTSTQDVNATSDEDTPEQLTTTAPVQGSFAPGMAATHDLDATSDGDRPEQSTTTVPVRVNFATSATSSGAPTYIWGGLTWKRFAEQWSAQNGAPVFQGSLGASSIGSEPEMDDSTTIDWTSGVDPIPTAEDERPVRSILQTQHRGKVAADTPMESFLLEIEPVRKVNVKKDDGNDLKDDKNGVSADN